MQWCEIEKDIILGFLKITIDLRRYSRVNQNMQTASTRASRGLSSVARVDGLLGSAVTDRLLGGGSCSVIKGHRKV